MLITHLNRIITVMVLSQCLINISHLVLCNSNVMQLIKVAID